MSSLGQKQKFCHKVQSVPIISPFCLEEVDMTRKESAGTWMSHCSLYELHWEQLSTDPCLDLIPLNSLYLQQFLFKSSRTSTFTTNYWQAHHLYRSPFCPLWIPLLKALSHHSTISGNIKEGQSDPHGWTVWPVFRHCLLCRKVGYSGERFQY